MIHQFLVKLFLLLFVVNLQLVALYTWIEWLMVIAFINLVWLIVIMFQHRIDLTALTPDGKRTLFAPGVFLLIAVAVWLWLFWFVDSFRDVLWVTAQRGSIFWGILFWVSSVLFFGMLKTSSIAWKKLTQWLTALLLLLVLAWIWMSISWLWEKWAFGNKNINENPYLEWVIVELPNNDDELIDDDQPEVEREVEPEPVVEEPVEDEIEDPWEETELRYSEVIPLLVSEYNLDPISTAQVSFSQIPQSSWLYESFRIAQQYRMVWTNVNPSWLVWCDNAMVLRWIAEGWDVNEWIGVLDAYWNEAVSRNLATGSCTSRDWVVTQSILLD